MSDTIKKTVEHCIYNYERFEDNPTMRSEQLLGITRAEGEVFARIEAQLTAERDELKHELERHRQVVKAAWGHAKTKMSLEKLAVNHPLRCIDRLAIELLTEFPHGEYEFNGKKESV